MTTHGPFHSLSDADKQALTDQLHSGSTTATPSVSTAAVNCGISIQIARGYDKGLVKTSDEPRGRFITHGPDAVAYNKLLPATDVIESGSQAEPPPETVIALYREISSR